MSLTSSEVEALAAAGALRYARQRAAIREAITTWQCAQLLNASLQAVRRNFRRAVIREAVGCHSTLFSRAAISELLSEYSNRPILFPAEPLLKVDQASAFLLEHGVRLSPSSLCWYRSSRPELAPPFIRISPTEIGKKIGKARYSRAELAAFAEHRRTEMISQGIRTDLLKDSVATEQIEGARIPSDFLLTKQEAAAILKVTTVTLDNWVARNQGPPFVESGGGIRYPKRWLHEWLRSRAVVPGAA